MFQRMILIIGMVLGCTVANAQWDSITGGTPLTVGEPDERWFTVRSGNTAFIVDGDAGIVRGTLPLSRFSPAVRSHVSEGKIYSYGSFYSRDVYGEREDVVLIFDIETASPIGEIPLPPKTAGIGHSGMINLINGAFIGVWNITPASSVSIADIRSNEFIGEIATPGCAAVYPAAQGFLMPCGDGTVLYIEVDDSGNEVNRARSEKFFDVMEDPVYDYAVAAGEGWMFMSLEGYAYRVHVEDGQVLVADAFNINPENDGIPDVNNVVPPNDDSWRIGGRQAFAYHEDAQLLMTIMHAGGGQETFEDAGNEIWFFNMETGNRGFRLRLDDGVTTRSIQMTPDAEPLLLVMTNRGLQIRDARSGAEIRTLNVSGSQIQPMFP